MRAEIIVILVCFALMVFATIFCYACVVVASDADRRAEKAAKELEKEKQKREPRIVMLEGECAVRTLEPDSAERRKMEEQNERKE